MSLPPALLKRLAQRGLVQKPPSSSKKANPETHLAAPPIENEEVIAEDYDEMEEVEPPSLYESSDIVKRPEENFWLERMKLRIGESGTHAGHKGCPNKYNIYHKCTLFCVNHWGEGHAEPTRDYVKRYKRLLRRYPLPKGWAEMYDPGCGAFFFYNTTDQLVSWLPPTHPKSELGKCAATIRRQMEESNGGGGDSDEEHMQHDGEESEERSEKHQREVDDIIKHSLRAKGSPPPPHSSRDFPSLHESAAAMAQQRKQKSRDLEKTLSRQHRREKERGERERERERDRDRERERNGAASYGRKRGRGGDSDALDPMDPSAYSDVPRGKWSDGLNLGGGEGDERKSSAARNKDKRQKSRTEEELGGRSEDDGDYESGEEYR